MDLTVKRFAGSRRMSDEDAVRIGSFLHSRFGESPITANEVVEVARPARSPIHRDFEWNDSTAGHLYRLDQARRILRSIDVVVLNGKERKTRAYHQVTLVAPESGEEKRVYAPATLVWKNEDLAAQIRAKALSELRGWIARFNQYEELSGLVENVDQLLLEFG